MLVKRDDSNMLIRIYEVISNRRKYHFPETTLTIRDEILNVLDDIDIIKDDFDLCVLLRALIEVDHYLIYSTCVAITFPETLGSLL